MEQALKFKRFVQLTLNGGSRVFTDLKMVFRVERMIGDQLAKMTVDIYNILADENDSIVPDTPIKLEAGYEEVKGTIFAGVVTNINTFKQQSDVITRLYCSDSKIAQVMPMVNFSFTSSISLTDLISDIAFQADVDIAVLNHKANNVNKRTVISDTFGNVMDYLASSYNFRWNIFNGSLYVHDRDSANTANVAFVINAFTGLLETPVLTGLGVNVKMLMEPSLKSSDRFIVESKGIELTQGGLEFNEKLTEGLGVQQVQSLVHTGDTHGDMWYTEIIGERVGQQS